jgi:hypothetical protein
MPIQQQSLPFLCGCGYTEKKARAGQIISGRKKYLLFEGSFFINEGIYHAARYAGYQKRLFRLPSFR